MELNEAADALFGVAALLEQQGASPYRVRAYRRAARGLMMKHVSQGGASAATLPWLAPRLRRKVEALGAGTPPGASR
jgi:DNA polymerase/3'-5' exonuclease PolX